MGVDQQPSTELVLEACSAIHARTRSIVGQTKTKTQVDEIKEDETKHTYDMCVG